MPVAVALLALLAGCGSGGSNDHNVSGSPQPPASGGATPAPAPGTPGTPGPATPGTPTPPGQPGQPGVPGQPGPGTPPPPAPPAPLPPPVNSKTALISSAGVRGDVLLTMIDQQPCAQFPKPASSYRGAVIRQEPTGVTDIFINAMLEPGNYQPDPAYSSPKPPPPGQTCVGKIYRPAGLGQYTLSIHSTPWYQRQLGSAWLKRGFNWLDVRVPLTVTATHAELGAELLVESTRDNTPYAANIRLGMVPLVENVRLPTSQPLRFTLAGTVRYGVLKQWRLPGTGQMSQLMLLRGETANEAKLCWNTDLKFTKRLHCVVWQVPAKWRQGRQLKLADQYLVEDRAPYPGERPARFLFWRSKP